MSHRVRTMSKDKELVERQRKLIMKSAIKVFLQKGYNKATMREVAKAAGMAPGNIYHYIGTKDDILHLISIEAKTSIKRMKKALRELKGKNAAETLEQSIRLYLQGSDNSPQARLFYNREIQNFSHEDRAMLMNTAGAYTKFFERLIRNGIKSGEFKVAHPFLLAHNIYFICEDWALRRWNLRREGDFTVKQYADQQIDLIMGLLTASGKGK